MKRLVRKTRIDTKATWRKWL